jgi:hypothetical protein
MDWIGNRSLGAELFSVMIPMTAVSAICLLIWYYSPNHWYTQFRMIAFNTFISSLIIKR